MVDEILRSLAIRLGEEFYDELMRDYVTESIAEVKDYLNYGDNPLPDSLTPIVKKITMAKYNTFTMAGIKSESYNGFSQSINEDSLTYGDLKRLRKHRRMPK